MSRVVDGAAQDKIDHLIGGFIKLQRRLCVSARAQGSSIRGALFA